MGLIVSPAALALAPLNSQGIGVPRAEEYFRGRTGLVCVEDADICVEVQPDELLQGEDAMDQIIQNIQAAPQTKIWISNVAAASEQSGARFYRTGAEGDDVYDFRIMMPTQAGGGRVAVRITSFHGVGFTAYLLTDPAQTMGMLGGLGLAPLLEIFPNADGPLNSRVRVSTADHANALAELVPLLREYCLEI